MKKQYVFESPEELIKQFRGHNSPFLGKHSHKIDLTGNVPVVVEKPKEVPRDEPDFMVAEHTDAFVCDFTTDEFIHHVLEEFEYDLVLGKQASPTELKDIFEESMESSIVKGQRGEEIFE